MLVESVKLNNIPTKYTTTSKRSIVNMSAKIQFLTPMTGCKLCPDACCTIIKHEDIELGISFTSDMSTELFIEMMVRFLIADTYIHVHVHCEEEVHRLHKQITKIDDEMKSLNRIIQTNGNQELAKKRFRTISTKIRELRKQSTKRVLELKNLYMKLNRLGNDEMKNKREWKTFIRNNWDQSKIRFIAESYGCMNDVFTCMFHREDHQDCIDALYDIYPEISMNFRTLVDTQFQKEKTDEIKFAEVPILKEKKEENPEKKVHMLIKRSRYRYEYLVGLEADINLQIGNDDIEFFETISSTNPDYEKELRAKLDEIIQNDNRGSVSYSGNFITLKKNAKITIKQIASVYKTIHL